MRDKRQLDITSRLLRYSDLLQITRGRHSDKGGLTETVGRQFLQTGFVMQADKTLQPKCIMKGFANTANKAALMKTAPDKGCGNARSAWIPKHNETDSKTRKSAM